MDKDKLKNITMLIGKKIAKVFRFTKEYCNNYIFSTSIILTGLIILLLNVLAVGFYGPFILGVFFIGLHFFYKRNWIFSLAGSMLMTIGIYLVLLLSYIFTDGGESAIILAVGLGFLVFYCIEGKWSNYWPLIPGIPVTAFGVLVYGHQTGQYNVPFLEVVFKFWPLAIILFGVFSLFSRNLKNRIVYIKNRKDM